MAAGRHRITYINIKRIGLRPNVYGPPPNVPGSRRAG